MKIYSNILFCNFSFNERTIKLSEISAKKNGFVNYVEFSQNISFYEKMNEFFKYCHDNIDKYDYFIRSDADRIILPGISELIFKFDDYAQKGIQPWFAQGTGYEYLMLKQRNATPNIYSKDCVSFFSKNYYDIIKNKLKPETEVCAYIKNRINKEYDFDLVTPFKTKLTNLHEFEQHPYKLLNSFFNRLLRNQSKHFSWNDLKLHLPEQHFKALEIGRRMYNKIVPFKFEDFDIKMYNFNKDDILEYDKDFVFLDRELSNVEDAYNYYAEYSKKLSTLNHYDGKVIDKDIKTKINIKIL